MIFTAENILLIGSILLFVSIVVGKTGYRFGVPALLLFLLVGMFFGSDGLGLQFHNAKVAQFIGMVALSVILFSGGMDTKFKEIRPILSPGIVLSTVGVLLTALFTGLFIWYLSGMGWTNIHFPLITSLLLASTMSSTDSASVFAILRSQKMNLKHNLRPMLELESGSNDPWAYMLTVILLSVMQGGGSAGEIAYMIFAQVVFGVLGGVLFSLIGLFACKRLKAGSEGFEAIYVTALALLAYAVPAYFGGNGYLSAYILGIVLGNSSINNKKSLVNYFDGMTGIAQMSIFFLLGLLSFPSQMPAIILPAVLLFLFLTFIARPLAVSALLLPFRTKRNAIAVVAFAGFRGATSIVFAIMATVSEAQTQNDLFHMVFCVVLLSIALQGSLLPLVSKKLHMIDENENVMKTFTDYSSETHIRFIPLELDANHAWIGCRIRDITLPPKTRIVLILRGEERVIPKGNTTMLENDTLILSATESQPSDLVELAEQEIDSGHEWLGQRLADISLPDMIIVLVKRNGKAFVPNGDTRLREHDRIVSIHQ